MYNYYNIKYEKRIIIYNIFIIIKFYFTLNIFLYSKKPILIFPFFPFSFSNKKE